jgi:ribonuclease-3
MEFLGDAVLGMVAAEWLYLRHAREDEGRLTRMRAAVVSRRNLSRVARRLELGAHLRLGRGEERSGGRQKSALLADALEAVIAAIYLDGGLPAVAAFVDREIMATEEPSRSQEIEDFKSAVQEWLQARGKDRAVYALVESGGLDHAKSFTVELRVRDEVLARSTASSKKQAEQECAQAALEILRKREAK